MQRSRLSRDDKSSWKPDRFERERERRDELRGNTRHRYFQQPSNRRSLRSRWVSCSFFSFLPIPPPPVTSPSSWSPSLDFLRIRLEEAINHLVARTDGSQFGEHFYLTAARRTFRTLRIIQFYAFSRITKHRDVCFYSSQIRKKQFGCLRFKSSNL